MVKDAVYHAGPHGGHAQERSERPGAVGGRFCSSKQLGYPLVSARGCDCLSGISSWRRIGRTFVVRPFETLLVVPGIKATTNIES